MDSKIHRAVDTAFKAIFGHGTPGGGDGFDDDSDKPGKGCKSSKKKKRKKGKDSSDYPSDEADSSETSSSESSDEDKHGSSKASAYYKSLKKKPCLASPIKIVEKVSARMTGLTAPTAIQSPLHTSVCKSSLL